MNRFKTYLLPLVTLLIAGGLLLLRQWQLRTAFDIDGIPIRGHHATLVLLSATVAAALVWLLWSRTLSPAAALASRRDPLAGLLALVGAAAIALSSVASLYHHTQLRATFDMAVDAAGLIAALCLCVTAGLCILGRAPHPGMRIVPYVFLMLRLVSDFRGWSSDPIILDYCFRHFGLIFALCGLYCMASLGFGQGKRRLTAFWAMGALCLCVMALAGIPATQQLLYGGLALTMLGALLQLTAEPTES